MGMISYTFPSDFRHEALRGFTATGGKAVVRGGATITAGVADNGDDEMAVNYRQPELGIEFEHGPNGRPFSISVARYPELQELAREQVLDGFAVSETHSIERTTEYVNTKTAAAIQFGKIRPGKHDVLCSVGCAKQAEADSLDYSQVFSVVKHPEHGYMGVTALEFAALGLDEIQGWDFLAAA